jgi:predicted ribosome quality control (RQC) complex YloA/Tae2 family protein
MNYDVFTIAALVDEMNQTIAGGKVQDTLEIGDLSIGLEIYAGHHRHYLLISAHPQDARVHIAPDKLRRGVENPSPIGLMLRRYIEGGRLMRVMQPSWERVIYFDFAGAEGEFTLIAEPIERRANILLVRDDIILDCVRRVGADENRVRVSLPNHEYIPPPPQESKRSPTKLSPDMLQGWLDLDLKKQAWRVLTEHVLGYSPMLAKETIHRAVGRPDAKAGDVGANALFGVIEDLIGGLLRGEFEPGVTESDGQITGFAPYRVTHLPGWRGTETMSAALGEYYGAPVGIEAYDAAKKPIREMIADAVDKLGHRLASLQRSHRDETERERLRQSGELLLAYQYQVKPGDTTLSAQYDFDAPPLTISIDPTMNAVENAKAYFEKYEKAKRAAEEIPGLIKEVQREIDFLRQLDTDLALAANFPEIGEVQDALQAHGYWKGAKTARPRGGKSAPIKVTQDGLVIWVGRNSRQNEEVTFIKGKPEDTWLHARGIPGAHVIIKNAGRPVPPNVLQRAAGLAAYYSAARTEGRVLVDVTERRHVRKIKGGAAGMVTYRNESPIEATPTGE